MTDAHLTSTIAALTSRLDVLESKDAIRELRNTFHDYADTDRWKEIGGLFAEDARLDYDYLGQAQGRAAITDFFASIPELMPVGAGAPFVRQFIHAHSGARPFAQTGLSASLHLIL